MKVSRKATNIWEDVCYIYTTKDSHPQYIKTSISQLRKQTNLMGKRMEQDFRKENICTANKDMKSV